MSRKIDASKWTQPYELNKSGNYYTAPTPYYQDYRSTHARSTAITACGFCMTEHTVYIWSFAGGGKKCRNCGALMSPNATLADKSRVINLEEGGQDGV